MVNNCANPVCHVSLKLRNSGDFYALERQAANAEFFWLCPECASRFELHLNAWGNIVPRLRGMQGQADIPRRDTSLRLMARAVLNTHNTPQVEQPVLASASRTQLVVV
jgi:hypothetical protein